MKCWVFCAERETSRERDDMKRSFWAHNQVDLEPWATDVVQGMSAMGCADTVCASVHAVWKVLLFTHPVGVPGTWKLLASDKQLTTWTRKKAVGITSCNRSLCLWFRPKNLLLFSPGWRSPIIPNLIRLPIIVLLPSRGWRRTCWSIIFPSSSRVNRIVVLLDGWN